MTHHCPGCASPIEPNEFCCKPCYCRLPESVRTELARAFQATLFSAEAAALSYWQTHPRVPGGSR